MNNQDISDEYLNSFVDNQLDSAEKIQTFNTIRQDDKIKERVCELRGLKEIVKQAYSEPPVYKHAQVNNSLFATKYFQALAASLLLLVGATSGWFTHAWSTSEKTRDLTSMLQNSQHEVAIADTRKVIVHLVSNNPARFKTALDETEGLLETYKQANLQIQVEVVANKQGVDLLRSDASAHKKRIGMMQAKYPNLNFLACGQTISKLRSQGMNVQLLPHVGVVPSAVGQIDKRLFEGWGYVRI